MSIRILTGDCRDILATLPSESVHCVVTSPPYWGLRDYGTGVWEGGDLGCGHIDPRGRPQDQNGLAAAAERADGVPRNSSGPREAKRELEYRDICGKCGARRVDRQIGLEESPEAYIATMVAVFRELRRVLRPDGAMICNVGDSYRDKQLQMMPARLAIALQNDGWILRSQMPWLKRAAMPESCSDRPTSAVEYVFLLTKNARYYWDAEAVRRMSSETSHGSPNINRGWKNEAIGQGEGATTLGKWTAEDKAAGRNFRNSDLFYDSLEPPYGLICDAAGKPLALDVNPAAFSGVHFATFAPKLIAPLIRCGTSERGCCAQCGAPWRRTTEHEYRQAGGRIPTAATHKPDDHNWDGAKPRLGKETTTTGWAPSCTHDAAVVPCTVLDPFSGAGTTLLVADRLQRNAIGIELNPAYSAMARGRVTGDAALLVELAAD